MSKNFGIAKKATSIAVRVLDADGSGSNAGVMAGIAFVGSDGKGKKSVANLSLGGSYSSALNAAMKAVVKDGIPFVVTAGNEAHDSCDVSPASEPTAITVMASDSDDGFASFSNFGKWRHTFSSMCHGPRTSYHCATDTAQCPLAPPQSLRAAAPPNGAFNVDVRRQPTHTSSRARTRGGARRPWTRALEKYVILYEAARVRGSRSLEKRGKLISRIPVSS